MKVLFLDTSSFFVTVAILDGNEIVYLFQDEIKNDMSSKIMPIIDQGFKEVDFEVQDLNRIIVVNGPGSFTGVRIGVTIAKVLAWSLKVPVITVSSLEFLATTPFKTEYIIPMIDARRGYVYAGVYDSNLNIIKDDQYVKYEDLEPFFEQSTIVSLNDLENSLKPHFDVLKLILKHQNDEPTICHEVKPNYLKKTEAEENLSKKND